MKTSHVLKISIALIFCCYSVVYAKNWKDDSKQKAPGKSQYTIDRQGDRNSGGREKHERVERRGGHDNQKYADYHKHRGYREHPHDKARHYGHYTYHGHQYDYHGHGRHGSSGTDMPNHIRKSTNMAAITAKMPI